MKQIRASIMALVILTIITGVIYPLFVTLVGKTFFPYQAGGSIILINNEPVGSELIGQQFTADKYLWSRPSATGNYPYNAMASGGSNLGPLNPALIASVKDRTTLLAKTNPNTPIPVGLVTASASGLDPEISIAGAYFQVARIAKARNQTNEQVLAVINRIATYPLFGFIGEVSVNVLKVNLALDGKI